MSRLCAPELQLSQACTGLRPRKGTRLDKAGQGWTAYCFSLRVPLKLLCHASDRSMNTPEPAPAPTPDPITPATPPPAAVVVIEGERSEREIVLEAELQAE